MGKSDAQWGAAFQNSPPRAPAQRAEAASPNTGLLPITPGKATQYDTASAAQTFDSALQQAACAAGAYRGSTAMRSSVPGTGYFPPSDAAPEGWLQKTPCGYWVGSVFIPRAWLTDKFQEDRLDPAMLWTFYFSRILTATIPIVITFVALIVSVSKKGCEWGHATTQSNQWLPAGFDDFWGPLLCVSLIIVAVTADAFLLQPLQLCMRSPVMPVWDGTLKQLLTSHTGRLLMRVLNQPADRFERAQPPLPQHYQRTMFRVDKRVTEANQRRLEKFGQEEGGDVIRTDAGVWYLRMENEPLLEIVFDAAGNPMLKQDQDNDGPALSDKMRSRAPSKRMVEQRPPWVKNDASQSVAARRRAAKQPVGEGVEHSEALGDLAAGPVAEAVDAYGTPRPLRQPRSPATAGRSRSAADAPRRPSVAAARSSTTGRGPGGAAADVARPAGGRTTSAGRATPGPRPPRRTPAGRSAPPAAGRTGRARRKSARGAKTGAASGSPEAGKQQGFGTATRKVMSGLLQMPFTRGGAGDGERGPDDDAASDDLDAQEVYGLVRNSDSHTGEQPDPSIRVDDGDAHSRADDEASPYEQRANAKRGRVRRGMSFRQSFKPPAQLFRADMLMSRLREFGVMGGEDEEAANVVDVTNVYQELPAFLQEKLPLWDMEDRHAHFITYFQHDPALGHKCEAHLRVRRCSTTYLKWCQIFFLITITASAVGFTSSISWCSSAIWIMMVSALISLMMWTIKAPCYVCLWSPGYQGKRIAQAVFNTLFTIDLWYDLTNFIHLAFVGGSNAGYVVTVVLYSMFVPLDMFNLFIRTGYCLEDIPARSHLFNLIFEVPMLLFNIYVMATQLQGENKMRGYVTIATTSSTICTAFLLWKFKPQVIKVRGELAQTLVKFGKTVGNTMKLTKKVILDDAIAAASDKMQGSGSIMAGSPGRDSRISVGIQHSRALGPTAGGQRPLLQSSSRLDVHAHPVGPAQSSGLQMVPPAHAALASSSGNNNAATLDDVRGTDLRSVLEPGSTSREKTAQRSFFCRTSSSTYSVQHDQDETQWCQYDNAIYGDIGVG